MRRDILDLMADELNERQVSKLASFYTFDESSGRPKLDGMAKGKKWDLEREQRDWEKAQGDLEKLAALRRNQRWRRNHPEAWVALRERYRPIEKAKKAAAYAEQRAEVRAKQAEYYQVNRERLKAKQRAYYSANSERLNAAAKKRLQDEERRKRRREYHREYMRARRAAQKAGK